MKYPFAVMVVGVALGFPMQISSAADSRDDFAKVLNQMMEAAPDNFKSLRGEANLIKNPDGGPMNWKATLRLPGASSGSIWAPRGNDTHYWLGMTMFSADNEGAMEKAMENYAALVKKVRECLPEEWKSKETKVDAPTIGKVTTTFTRAGDKLPTSIEVGVLRMKKAASVGVDISNKR